MKFWKSLFAFILMFSFASAEQKFSELVGPVNVQDVKQKSPTEVGFITWGGDIALFHANGNSLTTKPDSIFGKLGLNLQLVNGDDFPKQVKRYLSGDQPYLRGTYRMIGQASEVIGTDPRTKPVFIVQLTWSAGDHVVSREGLKTLSDLKGKKIAVQTGGPHVGLIDDILRAANLKWSDVEIVWVSDLTGPKGPAEAFRKDESIDACAVITPDMIGLSSGLDEKGSGAEGTVKGAHVLVSTAQMSRSIADVWVVRKDYYDANKASVQKFVAGYLKATEETVKMRNEAESNSKIAGKYRTLLAFSQKTFGEDVLPTIEEDVHGLLLDATFVGLTGNISFFNDPGNLNGFKAKEKVALDLAVGQGYATKRVGFLKADFDYKQIATLAGVKYVEPTVTSRIKAESVDLFPDSDLAKNTIVSFTISFKPNQEEFSSSEYGKEFERAVQSASTFGNAVVAVRGHADPTATLVALIKAGMAKGVIKRTGTTGSYSYFVKVKGNQWKPLDLTQTKHISNLIKSGAFDGTTPNPRETMQAALNLSLARAKAVRTAVIKHAKSKGFNLDESQIQPVGAGILEPVISKPKNLDEAKKNMRVEFRIVKVPAEAIKESDFDF